MPLDKKCTRCGQVVKGSWFLSALGDVVCWLCAEKKR